MKTFLTCIILFSAFQAVGQQSTLEKEWINNQWVNVWQDVKTYDANCRELTSMAQSWNATTNVWVNEFVDTLVYNSSGLIIERDEKKWDTTSAAWLSAYRSTTNYTSFDSIANTTEVEWHNNAWRNAQLRTCNYDANHHLVLDLTQLWDTTGGVWINQSQSVFQTDANGLRSDDVWQWWNSAMNSWHNVNRNAYHHNSLRLVDTLWWSNWDTAHWNVEGLEVRNYSSTNKMTELKDFYFDNGWINNHNEYLTYNQDDKEISHMCQERDPNTGLWYNTRLMSPGYNSIGWVEEILDQRWDTTASQWVNTYDMVYTYSCYPNAVSITQSPSKNFEVFPSPSSGHVRINCDPVSHDASVVLSNVLGQPIARYQIPGALELDIDEPAGFYLITIVDGGSSKTSSLIIQK